MDYINPNTNEQRNIYMTTMTTTPANKAEVMQYIKEKFNLSNLSDLELEFMLIEIAELTKSTRPRYQRITDEVVADIKQCYINGMPTSSIIAKYPQYGKSTITKFITEVRKERGIGQYNR